MPSNSLCLQKLQLIELKRFQNVSIHIMYIDYIHSPTDSKIR